MFPAARDSNFQTEDILILKQAIMYLCSLHLHQCCADIEIWWSNPIRKISVVSESDPDPKSMLKT